MSSSDHKSIMNFKWISASANEERKTMKRIFVLELSMYYICTSHSMSILKIVQEDSYSKCTYIVILMKMKRHYNLATFKQI